MPIEGFDYKAFANNLAKQAQDFLMQPDSNASPSSLSVDEKKYIIDTVRKFCYMSGEALYNDASIKFNADQASIVTQFIGEWTFHKSIDLITGKIPPPNRDAILQLLAANIFNTAKLAIVKKMPDDALINLVEEKVKKVYQEEILKLVQKGVLTEAQAKLALNMSNMQEMVQKNAVEETAAAVNNQQNGNIPASDKKVLKLASLAIVLKTLPPEKINPILDSLSKNDVMHVLNYMKMSNLEDKIDHDVIIKTLQEIKAILPKSDEINIPKLLKRYHKLLNNVRPEKLSKIALKERETVKYFILDTEFPAEDVFSPLVIKSLVSIIEDKINDN